MGKILKILKINILSVIALPVLLIATASKLIAKALEKLAVVLGMAFFTLALFVFFEILKNPGSILTIIAFIVVFILIVAVIILIVHFCFAVVVSVWSFLIKIFDTIYQYTYLGYLKLYEICTSDYHTLCGNNQKNYKLPCLFYTVLNGINKVIVGFLTFSLYLAIGLSALLVICTLLGLNSNVSNVLGINLLEFASKFDTFSLVYGIVIYLAIVATVIAALLSLGIEWHEWAQELKMSSGEYAAYIHQLRENELQVKEQETDAENEHMQKLSEHLAQVEALEKDVNDALDLGDNPLLRGSWCEYLRNLTEITEICNDHKNGIPAKTWKRLLPQINQLDSQRENVQKLVTRHKSEMSNPVMTATYFSGCDTLNKLEKRYKSLCKAYHPDSEGGDEETFKTIQKEYERVKKYLAENCTDNAVSNDADPENTDSDNAASDNVASDNTASTHTDAK